MPIDAPRQAGIYVRRVREAQGLTRAQLAAAAGVSERLLASLELGDATGIRLDKLLAVFGALGISLAAQGEALAPVASPHAPARVETPRAAQSAPVRRRGSSIASSETPTSYAQLLREIAFDQGIELAEEVD